MDYVILKYNSTGTLQWSSKYGSDQQETNFGATLDSNNNIYIVAYSYGSFDNYTNSGQEDIILIKFNSDGTKQ